MPTCDLSLLRYRVWEPDLSGYDIWSFSDLADLLVDQTATEKETDNANGCLSVVSRDMSDRVVEPYTGVNDVRGVLIFAGDIVRWRVPQRDSQTHYGENLPFGQYTEPLEPIIKTRVAAVVFKDGVFTWDRDPNAIRGNDDDDLVWPLIWDRRLYATRADLMDAFECRSDDQWLDGRDNETGDLSYLLREYDLADEAALMAYLSGFEVIGNVQQHPRLLRGEEGAS